VSRRGTVRGVSNHIGGFFGERICQTRSAVKEEVSLSPTKAEDSSLKRGLEKEGGRAKLCVKRNTASVFRGGDREGVSLAGEVSEGAREA